ncbi:thioredoxin family protein [Hymenobacter lapidiphilus]|uniref:Thioredoxin family protein n=1 Tax=Hymenobacter lapidiphilus TaxID=2608003 RepID=A0A7Y7PQW9_9BACT|nr:thioredoxin family protein [Hymenobacter lapidiphilus]NVO32242.1 thioredoxin family protein [Hymenobacter lapidiphilus]
MTNPPIPAQPPVLSAERLATAYTYAQYRQLIDELMAKDQTTGETQSPELTAYAKLNIQRMQRLDKKAELLPELQQALEAVEQTYAWLIITEGWCGDAAQIVPVLEKVAQASNGRISTHYLLRDENLDLMDQYLTNGGRAIPKLVVLHADTRTEAANWGPRPAEAQDLFLETKAAGATHEEFAEKLHGWYAQDKTRAIQQELLTLVRSM